MKVVNVKMLMPITISVDVPDELADLLKQPWYNLADADKNKIGAFMATLPHHADIIHFEIDGEYFQ